MTNAATNAHTIRFDIGGGFAVTITDDMLDWAVSAYLPASPKELRQMIADRTGDTYDEVRSVTGLLVILASSQAPSYLR